MSQRMRTSERSVVLLPSSKAKFVDLLRELLHIEHPMRSGELKQLSEFRPALALSLVDSRSRGYILEISYKVKACMAQFGVIVREKRKC